MSPSHWIVAVEDDATWSSQAQDGQTNGDLIGEKSLGRHHWKKNVLSPFGLAQMTESHDGGIPKH